MFENYTDSFFNDKIILQLQQRFNSDRHNVCNEQIMNKFELPDGLYSVSNIQDYFESILKKHGENINKPSVQIYVNRIENRITFKIKHG